MERAQDIIIIGGSAGSFNLITEILDALPPYVSAAICITIHRNKNFNTRIEESLAKKLNRKVYAVIDKMPIERNSIYFAPAAYHLLVEPNYTFSLDASEPINFSIPSIDVIFETSAQIYGARATAFLLSGANKDGAQGIKMIEKHGGKIFIQNPEEAVMDTMPLSAVEITETATILSNAEIIHYFKTLNTAL